MCGGDFMSKNSKEAMDFLSYVAEVSRGWDEPNAKEVGRMNSQPNASNAKVGMYTLNEVEECPMMPVVREMFRDQANVIEQFKPNNNAPYSNTYNSNWRNHPNLSWKQGAPQNTQPGQAPPPASSLEQAIMKLNKIPKVIYEMEAQEGESSQMREVKAVITLRSGKEVDMPTPKPEQEPKQELETEAEKEKMEENKGKEKGSSTNKEDLEANVNEKSKRTINQEEVIKKHMPPPFPQALPGKREINSS
ncbi:hypothetical protein CK203_103642 [Vitis vinifera]|uniref:Uncharacterized protein n=1 Tax=Vitis vinifera TaxID=29760 RepID=A0A438BQ70_VITVI|nr:hypothetical protein CK203_103642 [Vitis vinifera]